MYGVKRRADHDGWGTAAPPSRYMVLTGDMQRLLVWVSLSQSDISPTGCDTVLSLHIFFLPRRILIKYLFTEETDGLIIFHVSSFMQSLHTLSSLSAWLIVTMMTTLSGCLSLSSTLIDIRCLEWNSMLIINHNILIYCLLQDCIPSWPVDKSTSTAIPRGGNCLNLDDAVALCSRIVKEYPDPASDSKIKSATTVCHLTYTRCHYFLPWTSA